MKVFESIALMLRGLGLVWKASPLLMLLAMFLSVVTAFSPLASLWITKQIIDMLTKVTSTGTGISAWFGWRAFDLAALGTLLAAQLALWVGSKALESLQYVVQLDAQSKFEVSIMQTIMRKCETFDLAYFESPTNVDRLEKAMRGSMMSAWNVIWMMFDIIKTFTQTISLMLVLVLLNPLAPVVIIVSTLPQLFASSSAARARWKMWRDDSLESRIQYYLPWLITGKTHAQEVKFFNLTPYLRQQYEHFYKLTKDKHQKFFWKEQFIDFLGAILSSTGAIAVYLYICVFAFLRRLSAGDAVLYMGAVDNFQGCLRGVFHTTASVYEQMLYLKDLFGVLDQKPEDVPGSLERRLPTENPPRKIARGIEFRNVSFTYPQDERQILQNLSFTIGAHESLAIVGKNGAGKSTLVKLLLRLYDPTEGEILLDGVNLKDIDLNAYRETCSSIFQEFAAYALTLRENVGFGDIENIHDTPRIEEAIKTAGAGNIAERMAKGLEGYLTKHYTDEGEELSGGEWQKIALARAVIRNRAQIMILDEPTAALDAFAEFEIFKLFGELTQDRISILISHRFSTVRLAKKILVIDEGRLVEHGTHDELIAQNGLYADMYTKQADRYK